MTEEDSNNSNTDFEENEVISVKQIGKRLKKKLLIPMDEEEARKDFLFTTEIKVTVTKNKNEEKMNRSQYNIQEEANDNQDDEDME